MKYQEFIEGTTVAVWKPVGMTSHDVIQSIRRISGVERVGHSGTLDPLASGVLVIGIGREATKKLWINDSVEKEYLALIRLGIESSTDDSDGEKKNIKNINKPTLETVFRTVGLYEGVIKQTPPVFSAIKVSGKRAYARARRGEQVVLKSREVLIKKIEILDYKWPYICLKVVTGRGVYIRSLARDIGNALGVGAYLSKLERVRVGNFTRETCYNI
ncbi:tRNA pseudouridine(55) synthase TruB [Candidatus Jorgensenbacteria bacterium]|nr:tRNA pseudouridine(55) synthase TruB [Candidatus Jorgensenbacteria bacterium]